MPADTRDPARSFRVVLLCDTEAERIRGLQGFRVLAPREAALFIIDPSQPVSFWMADLSYGIDIIYVNEAGTVSEVHPELRPGSEEIFASSGPVRWVIETAAGSGVRPGDRIRIE
jgi:uncharacterized membrane protein (UPF0127 family)